MSCRFLFLLLFFASIFQIYFSSIHISPSRQHLQYAFSIDHRHHNHLQRRSISRDVFQIHIHYDRSVKKLIRDEQKLIHEAVKMATDYWSKTIRPKFKLNDRIRLARNCPSGKMFIVQNDHSVHYCSDSCLNETRCGDIIVPDEHLQHCHVCNRNKRCEQTGTSGHGVQAEFILYVSAIESDRCQPTDTLATASFCQLEPDYDRPIAGNINVCPRRLRGDHQIIDFDRLVSTIKHEILHTLVFSSGLYAFFRDTHGEPLTPRDPATRWPIHYDRNLQVYTPSDQVLKKIVRKNWKIRSGTIDKTVSMLVTPRVQSVVREHFGCLELEGAELEDQGSIGTALTHWEKRLFEHEIMTGTYTQESVISNLTLALLEDSGWYDVSYEYGKPLLWGRGLGCDFAQQSCKEWIDRKLAKKENPHPFCLTSPKISMAKRTCAYTYDKLVMCNLIEYNQPLPIEYQIFDFLPNITDPDDVARFGGHVMLANYCPYEQELAYKNSHRDSRCYRSENQPSKEENFALEQYSPRSKCFDHGSTWEQYLNECRQKRRIGPQAAGCYQYECVPSKGISIMIGNDKYLCEYDGQNITVLSKYDQNIYVGSILCPDCQVICGSQTDFLCPSQKLFHSSMIQRPTNPVVKNGHICEQFTRISKSDSHQVYPIMKFSTIIPSLLIFLYLRISL